jgi:hypothetical protein
MPKEESSSIKKNETEKRIKNFICQKFISCIYKPTRFFNNKQFSKNLKKQFAILKYAIMKFLKNYLK